MICIGVSSLLSLSIKNQSSRVGKSGIGKSILLKHIIGLMKPNSGEISINNKIINELTFKELQKIRKNISMVFQFGALFEHEFHQKCLL
mgnify:CR=1 FL=1